MPLCKFVTANVISAKDSLLISTQKTAENENEADVKHEYLSPTTVGNFEDIETASSTTEFSMMTETPISRPAQLIYGNETLKRHPSKLSDRFKIEIFNQNEISMKDRVEKNDTDTKSTSVVDHVYEEVSAIKESHVFEYDIMDYYEKYSPTTAKTLINTLFLPRHKICKQCANLQDSPVYSDSLIYAKTPISAREVNLYQQNDVILFRYSPESSNENIAVFAQYDHIQPCMLVYNYYKTSASSIFYYHGPPRDIFDLNTTLKPNILLISSKTTGTVNTELYHRSACNFYGRIPNSGNAPMTFCVNHGNILSSIKHVGYDTDLQNWMNYRNDVFRTRGLKQDDVTEHRANRSSLLLLEPLLLMPDLTSPRYRHGKNRISHSENIKIVKIVIAYTLSFFILATITFYIVYFT